MTTRAVRRTTAGTRFRPVPAVARQAGLEDEADELHASWRPPLLMLDRLAEMDGRVNREKPMESEGSEQH
jgi:hypothetical protein